MYETRALTPTPWLGAGRARASVAISRILDQEQGQGLTEYALILALIAVIAVAAVHFYGGQLASDLSTIASSV